MNAWTALAVMFVAMSAYMAFDSWCKHRYLDEPDVETGREGDE